MRPFPVQGFPQSGWLRCLGIAALCIFLATSLPRSVSAYKLKWRPIDQAVLAETRALVDSTADAEALFYEIHLHDTIEGDKVRQEFQGYERIKVYNERGQASWTQVELPYSSGTSVEDIAARTIRKDGTMVELKGNAVFDKTVVRGRGFKEKAKAFALPAVEPGCVVEYQWTEVRHTASVGRSVYPVQQTIPIREFSIFLTPISNPDWPYRMRLRGLHMTFPPPEPQPDGSSVSRMERVLAVDTEPDMPPLDEVRGWLVVDYAEPGDLKGQAFWMRLAREGGKAFGHVRKPSQETQRIADSLTTSVVDFDRRVQKLYEFCQSQVKDIDDDASGFTDEARERFEEKEETPERTLRERIASERGVEMLFAALASAAGFKTRIALLADRSEMFFDPEAMLPSTLSQYAVAVHIVAGWRFYDPAIAYVPCGMLPWWEEGEDALILDEDHPEFVTTPLSGPDSSVEHRVAQAHLDANGDLEADVRIVDTGHFGYQRKEDLDAKSLQAREDAVREEAHSRWGTAKISQIRLDGITDPFAPPMISYHLAIPQYAQRVGRRLLLQPGLFQEGERPYFPASTRRYPIYFHYPSSADDSVLIELPPGFAIDSGPVPSPLSSGRMFSHRIDVAISSSATSILFRRFLRFGDDGTLLIPASEYGKVKGYFDTMQQRDGYTITLTPVGEESSQR